MNHISIDGSLVFAPEKKPTQSGKLMATARIAKNGSKDGDAEYFNVTAFDTTAQRLLDMGSVGRRVVISGRLRYRQWEDENGKRSAVDIVANQIVIAERTPRAKSESDQDDATASAEEVQPESTESEKEAVAF